MTYFFVVTFFVAIVTLDEQRIAARRNFLIPCIVHDENKSCSGSDDLDKPTFLMKFLEYVYRNLIFTKVGKVVGLIPVIVLTLNCLYHVADVQRTFSITAVINRDSYYYKYLEQKTNLYPNSGYEAIAMMGRLNYSVELPKIFEMTERLENSSEVLYDVNSWVRPFHKFVSTFYGRDISSEALTETEWNFYLSQFLFSSAGGAYNFNFKFATPIECGRPAPEVKLSTIDFKFRPYKERDKYIPIKKNIDKIVEEAHLDSGEGYSAIWSRIFFYWIPNSAIDSEILRNLSLGWLSVAVCTSILIANMQMCFWIQACVLLTMVSGRNIFNFWTFFK
jgi:Niemann-Pick C1 protein